jgi:ribose 5-phosphate isomerase B
MARKRLVTEGELRRLYREGVAALDPSQTILTPLAADLARRLGIAIAVGRGSDPEAPSAARAAGAPAAGTPARSQLCIACGADHGGVALKDRIVGYLRERGHQVVDHGTQGSEPVDYPDFALAVARSVAAGAAQLGIVVDGAGIGSCIVANKVAGVRAANCHDITTAVNAREHNDANVLALGGGLVGERLALAIVDAFLATPFAGGRHARRVAKIEALDRRG